ncbi:MAG: Fic family protein [Tenericutes bacterium HGW-Tenericutes-2]|jgi:Fic family protein|nr:MAG: Fic family protein [Tenericutes bacterium HGW-Tenericutes-2]
MNRSGQFVSNLSGILSYQSFKPSDLPPTPGIIIDDILGKKMNEAYHLLGKLDGISRLIPNRDLFISMYVRKEALLSSQIEGTQATLDDIFDPHLEQNMNLDVEEVIQYLKALHHGNSLLQKLPISIRLIKEIHQVLLSSSRGREKEPGEFRRTQNWIDPQGSSLKNAKFIPPNIHDMMESLSNLESYIRQDDSTDSLIKIALIHYQFETIHPFLDGNGRLGRLLISILLKHYGLLEADTLYLSYYLKRNRIEYYDRLMDVRLKGHYEAWITFFLEGVIESSKHALNTIEALLDLREKHLKMLTSLQGKTKQTALLLFDYIESHPIIDIKQASIGIKKAFNTVSSAIETFEDFGILKQVDGNKRYRIFAYEPYLSILRDGTV